MAQWISVEVRLPKDNHYPLLTAAKTPKAGVSTFQTAWYSRMQQCWYAYPSDKPFRLKEITHWMDIDFLDDPNAVTSAEGTK